MKIEYINCLNDKFNIVKDIRTSVFTNEQGADADAEFDKYDRRKDTIYILMSQEHEYFATGRIVTINKTTCKIGRIAVAESFRERGIGSRLVTLLIERCKDMGFKKIYVDAQLHAVNFYKRLGFEETGEDTIIDRGIEHLPMILSSKVRDRKKINILIGLLILIVILAAIFGILYSKVKNDINGSSQEGTTYVLEITESDFEYEIGTKLYENDIVIYDAVWTNWMSKNYPNFRYVNGEYKLTSNMSYEEIAEKLQNPDISHEKVKVVIPEGYNVFDIAKRLEEKDVCSKEDFLNACKNCSDYGNNFFASVPENSNIAYQLEGFLFPATYDFGKNSDPKDVVEAMLDAFEQHFGDDIKKYCEKNNMTLYEFLTLCSIVQEEAFSNESAKNIASVFTNRLNKGMKLESDVTYYYARDLRDEYGFSQKVYDSYYTYRCNGLPSGPICNSGDAIIEAVINHPDTEYIYFYSDLNKEFHFAKTYDEFIDLQKKYPWK